MIPKTIAALIADGVMRGNVISDMQFSGCIRAHDETKNGETVTRAPGVFRAYDVEGFKGYRQHWCVHAALQFIAARKDACILYVWRRGTRSGSAPVYGATITDDKHMILRTLEAAPRHAAIVDACNAKARLWPMAHKVRYVDSRNRLTATGMRFIRIPEHGPQGRAWFYFDGAYHVRCRDGFGTRLVATVARFHEARALMLAADAVQA